MVVQDQGDICITIRAVFTARELGVRYPAGRGAGAAA
jgi:hypothetical protein